MGLAAGVPCSAPLGLALGVRRSALNFHELGVIISLYYLKAFGAYFYVSIHHITGMCICWSNSTVKYLKDHVRWIGTAAFPNLLNCFHNFHNSNHFLLDYEPQVYMFILDLSCEYQGFITTVPSKQFFCHYMYHSVLNHLSISQASQYQILHLKSFCIPNSYVLSNY